MRFVADLHLHSRFSRATSREADLAGYWRQARIKGIDVVGTGDFTHPRWFEELSDNLVEDNGLYRLREPPRDVPGVSGAPTADTAAAPAPVRFMLTTEISSIYRKHGQVRKVHTLVCLPSLEEARRLSVRLAAIGNIASDGRPILGLDPKDLLSIVMEVSAEGFIIPAHIWTPWFSIFGSKSGFDAIEECFEELTPHIFALETGLSSDPPMNWRWSALDRYRLVSNSDAHSPGNLGREANLFDTEPSWTGIRNALRTGQGFQGTLEFYPEEGKYHFDGHRKCGVCMDPAQTASAGGTCPVCGRPLTIGVLSRVLGLADRDAPSQPRDTEGFRYVIPLPELLSELAGSGRASSAVADLHARVVRGFGSEFAFLLDTPVAEIERSQGPLLAEAVRRMREGRVVPQPGYDGEFGIIRVFDEAELARLRGQDELFPVAARARGRASPAKPFQPSALRMPAAAGAEATGARSAFDLDAEQQAIVDGAGTRSVVFAGPGTGKTRLLAAWVARHADAGVLALTFTNKATRELRDRLALAAPGQSHLIMASTFHALCWAILRERDSSLTTIITPAYRAAIVRDLLQDEKPAGVAALCERMERVWDERELPDARLAAAMAAYDEELRRLGAADVGSLVHRVLVLFREDAGLAAEFSRRFGAIAVDELQDINLPQYELLKALVAPGTAGGAPGGGASTAAPVLAIGDPDQSIYGFRGSDRDLFFRFRAEPGTRSFGLARNYRSTSTIVEAAEAVVAGERTPGLPPLGSSRGPGQKIRLAHPAHPEEEGRFIAGWIRDLVGGVDSVSVDAARSRRMGATERPGHYSFSDIAVLFRSRAVRDALLPGLLAAGLPLSTGVAAPLTEEEPFLSIAAVLRLLADPSDSVSIRILTARAGTLETQRPMEWLSGNRGDLDQVLGERGIAAVMDRIAASAVPVDRSDPTIALGYETLRAAAEPFGPDLRGFLAHASSCTREGEGTRPVERISLLTFHAAKGLEFPVVFIAGAEDAVTPGARATAGELAEERRLFYVAMTRARDMLLVSHCARRREHGEVVPASPSRFLADIPARCRTDEDRPRRDRDAQLPLFG